MQACGTHRRVQAEDDPDRDRDTHGDRDGGRRDQQREAGCLRDALHRDKGVQLKWHDPKATLIEGLASRGDRRLGPVIEQVWRNGGVFQEWSEHFDLDLWEQAMADHGLSTDWYVHRHRTEPRRFFIYEQYNDDAALEAHRNAPHFQQYAKKELPKMADRVEGQLFEPLG